MIPLFKVAMNPLAKDIVGAVLDSGFIGQGDKVDLLESLLEKDLGAKPLTVNSCTSALDLALHLCGIGPGDEVISTPMSCYATQVGVQHRYARIRWADVDPLTGNINPDSVEKLITPKTKAIMAVDWAGRSCDYKKLKSFGVPVIQDAAHVWGRPLTLEGGNYTCYSLQAIKFLTSSDGGLLITPPEDYERALLLRWYGMDRRQGKSMRCLQPVLEAGFKYHMNDVMASIAIANLDLAKENVTKHRANAALYDKELAQVSTVTLPPPDPTCSYWLYSLLVEKGTKEEFIAYMGANGIACSPVHHRNDLYEATAKFKEGPLPGLDEFAKKQVSIPVGWWLTEEDLKTIIEAIKGYRC